MRDAPTRRRLVLLRHARAEYGGLSDDKRALSPVGRRQAAEVGASLAGANLTPDVVLCSSALRTRQTCEIASSAWGGTGELVVTDELYVGGVSGALAVISEAPAYARTLLVVGHEPVMSGVAAVLAGGGSDSGALARVRSGVPVGAYSVLDVASSWSELRAGSAALHQVVVPAHVL